MSGQLHVPAALLSGKNPVAHWIGDWLSPRVGLDDFVETFLAPAGFRTPDRPARILCTLLSTLRKDVR